MKVIQTIQSNRLNADGTHADEPVEVPWYDGDSHAAIIGSVADMLHESLTPTRRNLFTTLAIRIEM